MKQGLSMDMGSGSTEATCQAPGQEMSAQRRRRTRTRTRQGQDGGQRAAANMQKPKPWDTYPFRASWELGGRPPGADRQVRLTSDSAITVISISISISSTNTLTPTVYLHCTVECLECSRRRPRHDRPHTRLHQSPQSPITTIGVCPLLANRQLPIANG